MQVRGARRKLQGWPEIFKLAQYFDCKSLLTAASWPNFWANPVTFALEQGLGRGLSKKELGAAMAEMDADGSGQVFSRARTLCGSTKDLMGGIRPGRVRRVRRLVGDPGKARRRRPPPLRALPPPAARVPVKIKTRR